VTALVSRKLKAGCEPQFERVTAQMLQVAARAPSDLGSHLMHPGEEADVEDMLYPVVIAFDSQAHLDAWQVSEERALGLAATAAYLEGVSTLRNVSGLARWFRGPRMTLIVVATMTWLVAPALARLFGPWLNPALPSVLGRRQA
jgi:uncharacterized protein